MSNKTGNKVGSLAEFDKAVTDGFRLVPAGVFGETITLAKVPSGKHYEYRFAKDKVEADELRKTGFAELRLSDPIWINRDGFEIVFERELAPRPN